MHGASEPKDTQKQQRRDFKPAFHRLIIIVIGVIMIVQQPHLALLVRNLLEPTCSSRSTRSSAAMAAGLPPPVPAPAGVGGTLSGELLMGTDTSVKVFWGRSPSTS